MLDYMARRLKLKASMTIYYDVMRAIATFLLFVVAIAAQAVAPVAAHGHDAASQGRTPASEQLSQAGQETASATDHHGHDSSATSAEHCTAIGHCPSSAINADRVLYRVQFSAAARIASRVSDEAAPGFTFPPYRPPSPL